MKQVWTVNTQNLSLQADGSRCTDVSSLYLLLGASLWPELEQPLDDLLGEGGVLLQELHHAVGQLGVVQRQAAHLATKSINNDHPIPRLTIFVSPHWLIDLITHSVECSPYAAELAPSPRTACAQLSKAGRSRWWSIQGSQEALRHHWSVQFHKRTWQNMG